MPIQAPTNIGRLVHTGAELSRPQVLVWSLLGIKGC